MKRRRLLVAVALLASLQGVLLPGEGKAHDSSYCGHESSGYKTVTRFERQWDADGRHWHEFSHWRWGGWEYHPREVRACPH